jgi:chromosome partitioning protein
MKVLSCYSIKGGVGKTATAVNLACYLSTRPMKTLLVDLDPQGAAGFYFGAFQKGKFEATDSDELREGLERNIQKVADYPSLDIVPSHLAYRQLDLWLDHMKKSRKQLRKVLLDVGTGYDVLVLDCPPGITLLSESIFRASDLIIVPVIPTPLSVRTYEQLVAFFDQEELPGNRLVPFFSMVQRRRIHEEVMSELRARDSAFLSAAIPHSSVIERMGVTFKPILASRSAARPVAAFRELCEEIWSKATVL